MSRRIASVLLAFFGIPHSLEARAVIVSAWTLLPPTFFFIETWWIHNEATDAGWDQFKFGQEQATKIWVAVVTVLFGLYFGKDFYLKAPTPSTTASHAQNLPPQVASASQEQRFVVSRDALSPTGPRRPGVLGFDTRTGRLCRLSDFASPQERKKTDQFSKLPKCDELFSQNP
jgi:hypothetical protein